jgi:hypothetical protein
MTVVLNQILFVSWIGNQSFELKAEYEETSLLKQPLQTTSLSSGVRFRQKELDSEKK